MAIEKWVFQSRTAKWFAGILTTWMGLALVAKEASAADIWSPNCTPDIIQTFPDGVTARCQQTGIWYTIYYAGKTNAYIDRVVNGLKAAEMSGKTVQFRDVGGHVFDAVALYR